jgi:hypothetical protein
MKHTVAINFMICLLVALALLVSKEPIVLAFLVLLHELPYGLEQTKMQLDAGKDDDDESEDADGRGIGFTAGM